MTQNIEQWKSIDGFPGYEVSDHGHVRQIQIKTMKGGFHHDGYPIVCLTGPTTKKTKLIHRLVAQAFIGEIPSGLQVNHIDGDKTNNHVSNLEYVTPKKNIQHSIVTGLRKARGGQHYAAYLTDSQVKDVCKLLMEGQRNRYIAAQFNVDEGVICRIKNGRTYTHLDEVKATAQLPPGWIHNRPSHNAHWKRWHKGASAE